MEATSALTNVASPPMAALVVPPRDDDAGALASECVCDSVADPRGPAGD